MRSPVLPSLVLAVVLLAVPARAQVSPGPAVIVLKREVLADNLFLLYSAETGAAVEPGSQTVWLGGWSRPEHMPRDRVFMAQIRDGGLEGLTEVLRLPRALVNDPSVAMVPGSDDLRMHVSVLSLDDVPHATERNVLWTARSGDGGATWTDAQLIIGQFNGLNMCGGWSPSTLVEGGQICVYYHGNSPCLGVYRTCFQPDGITLARPTRELSLPLPLANVDVSFQGGRYVMVGDFLGLSNFLEIRALESTEGETWRPLRGTDDGLLVRADAGIVFTPHVSWRDGNTMALLFSTRSSLTNLEENTILHRWTISVPPARNDAFSATQVGPSASGAGASSQQIARTEASRWDRERADEETGLQYTDAPLARAPSVDEDENGDGGMRVPRVLDPLPAIERDVALGRGNLVTSDEGLVASDHAEPEAGRDDSVQAIIVAPEEHVDREPRGAGARATREGDGAPGERCSIDRVAIGPRPTLGLTRRGPGAYLSFACRHSPRDRRRHIGVESQRRTT